MKRRVLTVAILLLAVALLAAVPVGATGPTVTPGQPMGPTAVGLRVKGAEGPDVYLGVTDLGVGGNRVQADAGDPLPDGTYPFTFAFDKAGNRLTASIPSRGVSLVYDFSTKPGPACPISDWNYMSILLRDSKDNGGIALSNVMLGSSGLGGFGAIDVPGTPGYQYWGVTDYDFSRSFAVTGDLVVAELKNNAHESLKMELDIGCGPRPPVEQPSVVLSLPDEKPFCGPDTKVLDIDLVNVANLYGYQFEVHYDGALASAAGAFVNDWFDTSTDASVPPGWDGACDDGVCQFAASKTAPGVAVNGSGAVAQVTFTGLAAGEFDVTVTGDNLSDRDGNAIGHATSGPVRLTACAWGFVNVSGVVSLQGRATPKDAGAVSLTDLGGDFGTYGPTSFDPATGAWSINGVKVRLAGSNYQFDATHGLYLANRMAHLLTPGEFTAPATRLKGGDANNDATISLSDLTCIGGAFGGGPATCGTTGSSDINADAATNIFDLVLAGGNYGLATPQAW